eukprot:12593038-Alexandrium_andersonii.AAC.1
MRVVAIQPYGCAVYNDAGHVLVVREGRSGAEGQRSFPKGRPRTGEPPWGTALRETWEETG